MHFAQIHLIAKYIGISCPYMCNRSKLYTVKGSKNLPILPPTIFLHRPNHLFNANLSNIFYDVRYAVVISFLSWLITQEREFCYLFVCDLKFCPKPSQLLT